MSGLSTWFPIQRLRKKSDSIYDFDMLYDMVDLCPKCSLCVQMTSPEDKHGRHTMALAVPSLFCWPELAYGDSQCGQLLPGRKYLCSLLFDSDSTLSFIGWQERLC